MAWFCTYIHQSFNMKKYSILFIAAAFSILASCADQSADSSGTGGDSLTNAEKSGTGTNNAETTPPATPAEEYAAPPSKVTPAEAAKDSPRTSISVGKDGASVKTKKGTGVSYDKGGIKVERKDVKIDIKRDTL
jgi:hypothetical protein